MGEDRQDLGSEARLSRAADRHPMCDCMVPYVPLGVLKPVADDVWLIDGPEVRMHYLGLRLPFPTRATVVRLPGRKLWIHSPVALDEPLAEALERLGTVDFLVAPNTLHYTWLGVWKRRWPAARVYAPAALIDSGRVLDVDFDEAIGEQAVAAWAQTFEHVLVRGDVLTEIVFLHRPSRSLILTDLIENFEAERVCQPWRWLMKLFGAADPDGKAPFDMQLSFWRARASVRRAVETMIAWAPQRVLIAHGRWYPRDGVAEIERAFRWVLPRRR